MVDLLLFNHNSVLSPVRMTWEDRKKWLNGFGMVEETFPGRKDGHGPDAKDGSVCGMVEKQRGAPMGTE